MRIKTPKSVLLSIALLLSAHAAAFWPVVVKAQNDGLPPSLIFTSVGILYGSLVIWLFFILIGKSWARTTYTIFAVLGVVAAVVHLSDFDVLEFILLAVRVAAVILLHIPMSDPWFMPRSPDNSLNSKLQP